MFCYVWFFAVFVAELNVIINCAVKLSKTIGRSGLVQTLWLFFIILKNAIEWITQD